MDKCEDRIEGELKSRMKDLANAMKTEEAFEEFTGYILAISETKVYKVELSWGGPQDYFKVEVNPETKEIESISYHFLGWFDGAVRNLRGSDFEEAKKFFENLLVIE